MSEDCSFHSGRVVLAALGRAVPGWSGDGSLYFPIRGCFDADIVVKCRKSRTKPWNQQFLLDWFSFFFFAPSPRKEINRRAGKCSLARAGSLPPQHRGEGEAIPAGTTHTNWVNLLIINENKKKVSDESLGALRAARDGCSSGFIVCWVLIPICTSLLGVSKETRG